MEPNKFSDVDDDCVVCCCITLTWPGLDVEKADVLVAVKIMVAMVVSFVMVAAEVVLIAIYVGDYVIMKEIGDRGVECEFVGGGRKSDSIAKYSC